MLYFIYIKWFILHIIYKTVKKANRLKRAINGNIFIDIDKILNLLNNVEDLKT